MAIDYTHPNRSRQIDYSHPRRPRQGAVQPSPAPRRTLRKDETIVICRAS
jgi:hypothetical protein